MIPGWRMALLQVNGTERSERRSGDFYYFHPPLLRRTQGYGCSLSDGLRMKKEGLLAIGLV
jgi:hypothetical protein